MQNCVRILSKSFMNYSICLNKKYFRIPKGVEGVVAELAVVMVEVVEEVVKAVVKEVAELVVVLVVEILGGAIVIVVVVVEVK